VLVFPTIVLRWWELWALNTRWDTTAYGSAAWTIVGFHTSLLALDVADTLGLTLFYYIRRMPVKSLSDVADNAMYWYFTVLLWLGAALTAYRDWRAVGGGVEDEAATVATRTRFVSLMGIVISLFSSMVIVAQWSAAFVFDPCMRA